MHVLTNAEKLIPLRDAASLAESRRLAGMRMVTGTTSPSTRYERISVSPASCSIKSEYVIASHAFKPQYKCINYTPAWEQRELVDIAEIVGGGTPDTNNSNYWDGDIDWYAPAELGNNIYAESSTRKITQAGFDSCSTKMLPADKTILFTSRAGIGNTAILRHSACTNQGFQSLVIGDADVYFVYSMSERIKKWAEEKASGSTFLEISGRQLETMPVNLPSLVEQQAIGSFFSHLDNLITLHQRKRQWLKWLDEGGEGTHHDIDILVFKFADDMKISVLCGVHACMTKSLGHTGNRYAGKQQQRGMGVP